MAPQLVNGTVADRPRFEVWPGNPVATLWGTMVGKKVVMAATGVVLIGFVIAHMRREGGRGQSVRCRRVHRLRRLRGGLPQRRVHALHRGQGHASQRAATGPA